ncbi:unnamed protein product [Amoebophrya sp. A120]|nr:unnamed protein product [Amoebophrya sp. A120]|eukprot:GSA120T00023381001.1
MCGILAILGLPDAPAYRKRAIELQKMIRHRGPDWSGIHVSAKNIICHERLAIVDPESGDQPLYTRKDDSLVLGVNGEIYNHVELEEKFFDASADEIRLRRSLRATGAAGGSRSSGSVKEEGTSDTELEACPRTGSDCEILLHLYARDGAEFLKKNQVCGMFGCVILDERTGAFVVARDAIGIIPLYYGQGKDGSFWVASEMKVLVKECVQFHEFPPGMVYDSRTQKFEPYLVGDSKTAWFLQDHKVLSAYPPPPQKRITPAELRHAFEDSVKSHLMADVPYGVLLSGGLDSSLVASITAKAIRAQGADQCAQSGSEAPLRLSRLHSFCIGLENSPDHKAAKQVADFLGTVHHAYTFTLQQGIDALREVIYHIETFDVTTIRASTPMFLMSRKIRATGIKMVLSGEGADEIFGGYLYFHKAPNREEFHEETLRKVAQLSKYDCLRANKATMAWSLEARVPFLDRRFLDFAFSMDPAQKMCRDEETGKPRCEKYLLRKAFDVEKDPYLPQDVLWRQKEQFSDGVGYSWIDAIQEHAEKIISDKQMEAARFRFPQKTPKTKEAYLYRDIFSELFGEHNVSAMECVAWQDSIACSSETALKWDASFQNRADASGRAVAGVHEQAYDKERFNAPSHSEEQPGRKSGCQADVKTPFTSADTCKGRTSSPKRRKCGA